jgi:hypothetical protein
MVLIECPKQGIVLLLGFGRVCNTFKVSKKYYRAQCIYGIPYEGYCECIK